VAFNVKLKLIFAICRHTLSLSGRIDCDYYQRCPRMRRNNIL